MALAAYASLVGGEFTNWDDNRFVTDNPLLDRGGLDYVRAAFSEVQFEAYAPLHLISYLPDGLLWPEWAGGFHLLNLVIFLGGIAVWFLLVRRLSSPLAAAVAVLALALHPMTVEPVAWISARKDLLALLFVGLVLLLEDGREGRKPSTAALIAGACALLSKVSTVCLPLLLFAHLRWLRGLPLRDAAWRAAPYAVGAAALSIGTWLIFRGHQMIPPARPDGPIVDVLGTIGAYLWWTVWPTPSPIYPVAVPAASIVAALVVTGVIVSALTWRRWPAAARYAAVAFIGALLPVANIVPIVFRFADRYALLAHAALVPALGIVLAWGWRRLDGRRAAQAMLAALVVALLAIEAVAAAPVVASWHDSRSLWARTAEIHPDVLLVRMKYGETLRDAGEFQAATGEYQAIIRMAPDDPRGYIGLFYCYARRFEFERGLPAGTADRWYAALAQAMTDPRLFGQLRAAVGRAGCSPCANTLLLLGLRLWPQPPATLRQLADEARRAGDQTGAAIYEDALKRAP